MSYSEWARRLVQTRYRIAGLYVLAAGLACGAVLYAVLRATGMGFISFVPILCILFGLWMAIVGKPQLVHGRAPAWHRAGMLAIFATSVIAALTAHRWLAPLLIR